MSLKFTQDSPATVKKAAEEARRNSALEAFLVGRKAKADYTTLNLALTTFQTSTTIALAGKEPTIAPGTAGQYWRGDKTWQALNKAAVGLSNVDNTSDDAKPISSATATALAAKVNTSSVGVANGVAPLGSDSKVPAANLPAALANTSGLPEGSTNLYFTTARVLATALTGLPSVTNVAIAAADTILAAFAKLQGQVAARVSKSGDTMTGPLAFPSYTKTTLPAVATWARGIIWVSDLTGGAAHCYSDGTTWRRMADGSAVN
jgi:hypothetical protein